MSRPLDWRRSWYVVGWVAVSGIAAGAVQTGSTLSLLTVPAGSLSSDCALKPPDPEATPILPTQSSSAAGTTVVVKSRALHAVRFPSPFPSNPWFGTDYKFRLMLRKTIDSAGPLRGAFLRVVHGATAIVISGPVGSEYFDAVSHYIQSLRALR